MCLPEFSWGDTVRVKPSAPADMRPGERGEVVAITPIDTQASADLYDVPVGSLVYLVEFGDGDAIEIQATWLEAIGE